MLLVERHYLKGNEDIIRLCSLSKELYNKCNYLMRKSWFNKERLPDITILTNETKELKCFIDFNNTKTAKQTIRKVLTDWSNFRKALIAYNKDKSKFIKCPNPPYYKKKFAQVIFYKETIKGGQSKKNIKQTEIVPNNNCFVIKSDKDYRQVIITPKKFGFVIEVSYERKIQKEKLNKNNFCCIDIGVNNLATITSNQSLRPILINGKIVKSINQYYNKYKTKTSLRKRYFRLENYFHHTSKFIIDYCIKNNIGKIIIGKNNNWKQESNLGKINNQNFVSIPFCNLIQKITYKAQLCGIDVVLTEESYTSQSSFVDNDILPVYYEDNKQAYKFNGYRKQRGLYKSDKSNFAINADINGSLNIGRKVIPEFCLGEIGNRSLVARPVVVNPLKAITYNGNDSSINAQTEIP